MTSTGISVLQEYLQKNSLKLPIYTLVDRNGPQHETTFTIRVTVGSYSAEGTAKTKQAAKHNAARAMIEVLKKEPNHSISFNEPLIDVLPTPSNLQKKTEMTLRESNLPQIENHLLETSSSINSVGMIQEMCAKLRMTPPTYEETNTGSQGSFTFRCIMGTFVKEATASTKKRAKQKSAELMRQHLIEENLAFDNVVNTKQNQMDDDMKILVMNTEKLCFPDNDSNKLLTDRAKMLFPSMKRNVGVTMEERNGSSIANFHSQFRNSIDSGKVKMLLSYYNSLNFDSVKSNIMHSETILKNMENILNIKTERKNMKTDGHNKYLVAIEFISKPAPLFREVGKGNSYNEAYLAAVNRTINGIHLLLI